MSKNFARSGADKFNDADYYAGLGGVPALNGCCAVLECRKVATHEGGDHAIFIGEVERISCNPDLAPLIFGDGKYKIAQPLELVA